MKKSKKPSIARMYHAASKQELKNRKGKGSKTAYSHIKDEDWARIFSKEKK